MMRTLFLLLTAAILSAPATGQTLKALFDNTLNETAGNADWIIDVQQPVPVPAQSGITPSTPESYWLGAISAWGVELAKRGFTVHTLTSTYGITYGNAGNPYDLANYDLFIVCEPQNPLTVAEKLAIRSFVQNGGGLMMVADHNASDRDSDGWDSPEVWNDLGIDTYFGLHFQSNGESNNSFTQVATNVSTSPADSIIRGEAGTVTALSYHAGTSIRLLTANNPTATGHVWMNGASHGPTQIMAATARYGNGKVGAVGDSSPADDGTGQSGNTLYNGWREVGATDDILFLNMSVWLVAGGAQSAPAQTNLNTPLNGATGVAVPAPLTWYTTATADRYQIQLSLTDTFASVILDDSTETDTTRSVSGLALNTTHYWRVRAGNGAGWGAYSGPRSFTTWTTPAQVQLVSPADSVRGAPAPVRFIWEQTPEATSYRLEIAASSAFTPDVWSDSTLTDTTLTVASLDTLTTYFWRASAKNAAGWGPFSEVRSFRIAAALNVPVAMDEGWRMVSVPVTPPDPRAGSVFPSAGSALYAYDAGYVERDSLEVGSGYWLRFTTPGVLTISGEPVTRDTIDVSPGWNLVGSISSPVATAAVLSLPPGIIAFPFYAFQGSYTSADTLTPGKGYWIRCTDGGKIILQEPARR